jgi:hypothetical protein
MAYCKQQHGTNTALVTANPAIMSAAQQLVQGAGVGGWNRSLGVPCCKLLQTYALCSCSLQINSSHTTPGMQPRPLHVPLLKLMAPFAASACIQHTADAACNVHLAATIDATSH